MTDLREEEGESELVSGAVIADAPGFEQLLEYLRRDRGFDFHGYKRATLVRRVERRMQAVAITGFREYMAYLESNPDEFPQLFNTILINVTAFFRDPEAWSYLSTEVLPRAIAAQTPDAPFRAWSAGCASGEEAFTVAMALAEVMGIEAALRRVKIYATDVDDEALANARQASYGVKEMAGVPAPLVEKYFELSGNRYTFHRDLRRCVIFGRHDLMQDAPISRIDLLLCRNTIMYFNAEMQKKILTRMHFALNDAGILFLGKAEMLLSHPRLFTPIDLKWRVFSIAPRSKARDRILMPPRSDSAAGHADAHLRNATFDFGPVAQLVIDSGGTLAHINERARALFDLTPRDIGRKLSDLEISYKPVELRSCIDQVHADHRAMSLKNVDWPVRVGDPLSFDVDIVPLLQGGAILGVQLSFLDVTESRRLQRDLRLANRELEAAYEEIQSTSEELETTNEELQSTVEELETTNEELQSTNEELETMNQELQSTNEELQTINGELQDRGGELNHLNAYLASILASLRVGVVVLNRDFQIRIWNAKSADLWGVNADEVIGKNFLNLDIGLPVDELRGPIRACMMSAKQSGEVLITAHDRRGKSITCRVTCTRLVDSGGAAADGVIVWLESLGEGAVDVPAIGAKPT